MPTLTLSSADIVPNSRMFWNVRPMPSAVTWCGLSDLDPPALGRHDRAPVERDLAGGRDVVAGDHVEERRLAGAVGADERDDRAARDVEVDVVDRQQPAEPLGHPARLDQQRGVVHRAGLHVARQVVHGHSRRASSIVSASRAPGPTSLWPCGASSMLSSSDCRADRRPAPRSDPGRRTSISSASRWRDGRKPCGLNRIMSTQDHAVDQEVVLGRVRDRGRDVADPLADVRQQRLVDVGQRERPEDRAPDVADAAEDDHDQDEDRDREVEEVRGRCARGRTPGTSRRRRRSWPPGRTRGAWSGPC